MTDVGRGRLAWGGTVVLAILGMLHASLRGPAWLDSAFVSFRYGENLARGHGLVFNHGEWVEGFLDPLWTVLWGLGRVAGVEPVWGMAVVGPLLVGVLTVLTGWLSIRAVGERLGLLAPLFVAAWPPVAVAARTGTDVVFVAVLLAAALVARLREGDAPGRSPATVLWLVLLALTGIPGLGLALVVSLLGLRAHPGPALGRVGGVALAVALLTLGRWMVYGAVMPNSWWAIPYGGSGRWGGSVRWLMDLLQMAPILAGGALFGVARVARGRREVRETALVLGAVVLVSLAWVLGLGPRRSDLFHPLMLVVGPMAVLAAMAAHGVGQLFGRRGWILGVGVVLAFGVADVAQTHRRARPIVTQRVRRMEEGRAMGWFLRRRFQQGERVGVHQPGVIPYYAELPVLDFSGQTDPIIAHSPRADHNGRGRPLRSGVGRALKVRPAVIVHPKLRVGKRPQRLQPPSWYPKNFGEHYATTTFSARPGWRLMERSGKVWVYLFVRRGVEMGYDESRWYPDNP